MSGARPVDVESWWRDLGSAALVGTARRPVPPLPELGVPGLSLRGARAEETLLSSAALGGMARLAGRVPGHADTPPESPDDERPVAPPRAVQLLELVLTQPPAGARQRTQLLDHWLRACGDSGCRLPHVLLPTALDLATAEPVLREATARVLDARGSWLSGRRPDWDWVTSAHLGVRAATESGHARPDPNDWARLPSGERVALLASTRAVDPSAGRALLESTWVSDAAKDRRAHLETLYIGLGPDDEVLLERALDDRAPSVREVAAYLLDGLPGSARADRMAARLRRLIHISGLLKRGLEVTLPDEPDRAGVRDGLGAPPPRRSSRGWWLERLAAGAPLDVWTTATGADRATTLRRLSDDDALSGIRRAAWLRRDADWALALLEKVWDPRLLEVLPQTRREAVVLARLVAAEDDFSGFGALLGHVPAPWTAQFSDAVVMRLQHARLVGPVAVTTIAGLVEGLHPRSLRGVEAWLDQSRDDPALSTHLRHLIQFHSVKRSITEAFT